MKGALAVILICTAVVVTSATIPTDEDATATGERPERSRNRLPARALGHKKREKKKNGMKKTNGIKSSIGNDRTNNVHMCTYILSSSCLLKRDRVS